MSGSPAEGRRRVLLNVRVVPRASRDEIRRQADGTIRIRLQAPPVEGKANAALVRFLARRLDLPRSAVRILAGANSRHKRLEISGLPAARVEAKLLGRTGLPHCAR